MWRWGRLGLELLFVALLYTAVGIVLGVLSAGRGECLDLIQLLLQNLVAILPLVLLLWKVEGTWWSVGGTCALALAGLHIVVPRMELLLDRGQSLINMPIVALHAVGAAAAALAALLMVLPTWQSEEPAAPYPWPAGEPVSYLWRLPALAGAFAVLHVLAARLGRLVFGQTAHPPILTELLAKLPVAAVVLLVLLPVAAHLGVRSRRRVLVVVGLAAVLPALGRWQLLAGWPAAFIATRVGLRFVADAGVAIACAFLMLAAIGGGGGVERAPQLEFAADGEEAPALEAASDGDSGVTRTVEGDTSGAARV
ncbi:MAG TPA: hypothetical protein P5234_12815 [Thermoanaerobaculaceae bacterium]|nr:hypothetical protein [Thermoanaerobaculaceae bacterium]HRS17114.1 hypothetical protein [Thermoanaerobaculaceae bacterium]